jgi:hypothetical protein
MEVIEAGQKLLSKRVLIFWLRDEIVCSLSLSHCSGCWLCCTRSLALLAKDVVHREGSTLAVARLDLPNDPLLSSCD